MSYRISLPGYPTLVISETDAREFCETAKVDFSAETAWQVYRQRQTQPIGTLARPIIEELP